jgi:hypothetical protein
MANVPPVARHWEKRAFVRGETYQVSKAFVDADGDEHPIGEQWTFISSMYSRFDSEMILCTRIPSGEEWMIPLIWEEEKQGEIIENWTAYFSLA